MTSMLCPALDGFLTFGLGAGLSATTLPEAIVAAIRADPTLDALLAGRVHLGRLPEGATYPALTLKLRRTYGRDLDGIDGTADARAEFAAHSADYLESRAIVAALVALFEPMVRADLSGVLVLATVVDDDDTDYADGDDASDDGTYIEPLTVTFFYEV